jgi:hypothetical protein
MNHGLEQAILIVELCKKFSLLEAPNFRGCLKIDWL